MNKDEALPGKITRLFLAELIGTFVLVFAGCGAAALSRGVRIRFIMPRLRTMQEKIPYIIK